jgi:hypothetical protein
MSLFFTPGLLLLGREAYVNQLRRIGVNLQRGTMMVCIVSVFVQTGVCHKLDDLQDAFCTVDVRNFNVSCLFLVNFAMCWNKPSARTGWGGY